MKVALKLILCVLASITLALVVSGWASVHRDIRLMEADLGERQVMMGRVLRAALRETRETQGDERARAVFDFANERISTVDMAWADLGATHLEPHVLDTIRRGDPAHVVDPSSDSLTTLLPVYRGEVVDGVLSLRENLREHRARVSATVIETCASIGGAALLASGLTVVFAWFVVGRPLRRLAGHARRIGAGDFGLAPLHVPQDEIGVLSREMNATCARLESLVARVDEEAAAKVRAIEESRHSDRLRTLGTLASGLAHELGTPLNVLVFRARLIASGRVLGEDAQAAAAIIVEQTDRMTELVRRLLDYGRRRTPSPSRIDLGTVCSRAMTLVEPAARKRHVDVTVHAPEKWPQISGDAVQIEQVFANLLVNAVQACPPGGHVIARVVEVTAERPGEAGTGDPAGSFVRVDVQDDGAGIAADVLPCIFEPFFTTKDVGVGTGLGLSIAQAIVRDHRGWIDVSSRPNAGSRFSVFLPSEAS